MKGQPDGGRGQRRSPARLVTPFLVLSLLNAACAGASAALTAGQTRLLLINASGGSLNVTFWTGDQSQTVPCGGAAASRSDAPPPPWHVTVRGASGNVVMFSEDVSPSTSAFYLYASSTTVSVLPEAAHYPWPGSLCR